MLIVARKVQMTQMPQMVALFNGVGGGAAMAVSSIEFLKAGATDGFVALFATVFTVVIGSISFTGSIITFLKLQELMTSRPVVLPLGRFITIGTALATVVMSVYLMVFPENWALWTLVALSLVMGILFVLPVGGADVPIVISLLNAFTGLSVAASGYVLDNVTIEPVNEIDPITTVKTVANRATNPSVAPAFKNSIDETAIAAPPPTPLNNATICV